MLVEVRAAFDQQACDVGVVEEDREAERRHPVGGALGQLDWRNRMEFALAVSFGSSLQVALFVAPVLVLIGAVIGQPMDRSLAPLEVAAVGVTVAISALIALDGESNWLEGALLTIVYLILAVSLFEL